MTKSSLRLHEPGNRQWFSLDRETAELLIYDEIGRGFFGGGVSAENFIEDIKDLKLKSQDTLRIRINSPGGDVFDGNTIYNYLRSQPYDVTVFIDGVAASAASIVAMAGDTISMPENSFLMIHNPWMYAVGDANTLREAADNLDKIRDGAVSTYLARVGSENLSREDLQTMMDEETWLTAHEALEMGFADQVTHPVKAAALLKHDCERYGFRTPSAIAANQRRGKENLRSYRKEFERLSLVR